MQQSMLIVCEAELENLRAQRRLGSFQYSEQARANQAVKDEITSLLKGKTYEQLLTLQKQISAKLQSGEPIDVEYWEGLMKELIVWKAKVS
jgi:hypothetical protein